jgi:hypothetical protein
MDAARFCAHCGTPVRGTRFCTSCGAPMAGPSVNGAQPSAPVEQPWGGYEPVAATTVLPVQEAPALEHQPPWLSEQAPPPPTRTRPNVFAVLVVAALVLSGWAIWRGVEEHTLSGSVLLVDSSYFAREPGSPCTGEGGYSDLGGGAQVVLSDDKGETLSTGRLSAGEFDGVGCVFSFALEDVTRSDFYGLTVASGTRGQLQYSYEELAEGDWSVQLSIGDDEW